MRAKGLQLTLLSLLVLATATAICVSCSEFSDVDFADSFGDADKLLSGIFKRALEDPTSDEPTTTTPTPPTTTTPAASSSGELAQDHATATTSDAPSSSTTKKPAAAPASGVASSGAFVPPFGAVQRPPMMMPQQHSAGHHAMPHPTLMYMPHRPAGFWPDVQQPMLMSNGQKPGTPFSDGLGKRLMALINGNNSIGNDANAIEARDSSPVGATPLQNNTIVSQLNKGMHTVYNNLSKMWNSTVQQQLNVLQDSFKQNKATGLATPFEQARQQQLPNFFKSMTERIQSAQDSLNKAWKQVTGTNWRAANRTTGASVGDASQPLSPSSSSSSSMPASPFGFAFNPFAQTPQTRASLVATGNEDLALGAQQTLAGFGNQINELWASQVAPHVNRAGATISRTWRDLTSGGLMAPTFEQPLMFSNGFVRTPTKELSNETLDSMLEGVSLSNTKYSLDVADDSPTAAVDKLPSIDAKVSQQFAQMQRDINKMWQGLTNTLQNTISNVRNAVAARHGNVPAATNEAESQVREQLSNLQIAQKNADQISSALQQQEAQNKLRSIQQQRNDLFDFQMPNFERMPIVTAVRDFWHQVPSSIDNLLNQNGAAKRDANNQLQQQQLTKPATS